MKKGLVSCVVLSMNLAGMTHQSQEQKHSLVKYAVYTGGAIGGYYLIKAAWNHLQSSTQRKITEVLHEAQRIIKILTPMYAVLCTGQDSDFAHMLINEDSYDQICEFTQHALQRITVVLKALELLSKELSPVHDAELRKRVGDVAQQLTRLHERLSKVTARIDYFDPYIRLSKEIHAIEKQFEQELLVKKGALTLSDTQLRAYLDALIAKSNRTKAEYHESLMHACNHLAQVREVFTASAVCKEHQEYAEIERRAHECITALMSISIVLQQ